MFISLKAVFVLFFAYATSLVQHSVFVLKRHERIKYYSSEHDGESYDIAGENLVKESNPSVNVNLDDFILNDDSAQPIEILPSPTETSAPADIGALQVLDEILKVTDDIAPKQQWSRKITPSQPPILSEIETQKESSLDETEKTFVMCSACKCAYLMSRQDLLKRNLRVRCSICDKEWFQSLDRLMTTDNCTMVMDMTETKINEIKRILADKNLPRYPRTDKVQLFVGNVPYTYTEKDLTDLFSEYGILSVVLVRDTEGSSKGFGFIEVRQDMIVIFYILFIYVNIELNIIISN